MSSVSVKRHDLCQSYWKRCGLSVVPSEGGVAGVSLNSNGGGVMFV